jgi:hypothetical protein
VCLYQIKRCFFQRDIQTQAVSLKESIEGQLKIPTRIRLGGPSALDVFVGGQKICSRKQTGRLPTADEITELIRDRE